MGKSSWPEGCSFCCPPIDCLIDSMTYSGVQIVNLGTPWEFQPAAYHCYTWPFWSYAPVCERELHQIFKGLFLCGETCQDNMKMPLRPGMADERTAFAETFRAGLHERPQSWKWNNFSTALALHLGPRDNNV